MHKFIFISTFLLTSICFGQNESVQKLKESSDKAKQSIQNNGTGQLPFDPVDLVNPFIGTGGHGHTYPGASAPFGMMQLSPDTRHDGWDGCGGYHYDDDVIYGFSHTHLSGTGVSDYADLLIVPQIGKPKIDPLFKDKVNGYGSKFDHSKERAEPGYYSVTLLDRSIKVELTVSERAGMHRYTFSDFGEDKYILLDLDYRDELLSSNFKVIDKSTVQGNRVSKAWAEEQHFYFYLQTSLPFESAEEITKDGRHKLLLKFPKTCREIQLRVGMSAVDEKGAKLNVDTEIPDFSFEKVKAGTQKKWREELSKIKYSSLNEELDKIFYTALYHSFLSPNVFSDVDGRYRGMDMKIHKTSPSQTQQYTVFSLWDTFRATHPLFTIVQEKRTDDFIETFLNIAEQGNDLPVWELAANETECMIGYHSVSVIADAYHKGLKNFDGKKALAAMVKTARDSTYAKNIYAKNGFISLADEPESVSKVLEYAYDDFCIAQMAKELGEMEIAKEFELRSLNFINLFDPESHFFRARRGGQWMQPFTPEEVNFNYTEANAWQYSLFAPHAIEILKRLHGDERTMEMHLDKMFTTSSQTSGRNQADITGLIGQYAHGNEPSHHMAYMYNYVARPDKTQKYVDSILKTMYSNSPNGLSGNEDCGQMSSWYVLSAMGFYPMAPGTLFYEIGRPLAKEAVITIGQNANFTIKTINNSLTNKFIQKIEMNGKEIERLFIGHSEIMNGGEMILTMGPNPSENVNRYMAAPSMSEIPENFCPLPYFQNESRVFSEQCVVNINFPEILGILPSRIEYRLDGGKWRDLEDQIVLEQTTLVEARTYNYKGDKGTIVGTEFVLKNSSLEMLLISEYDEPYSAGGPEALIDGIKGTSEFRTGDWQGFYGKDVIADFTLKNPKKNIVLEIGMLEDLKSWIFFPEFIEIEVSYDGFGFVPIDIIAMDKTPKAYRAPSKRTVTRKAEGANKIKMVRVIVKNPGECPTWHLGIGNPSWLFLDEITIQ